VQQARWAADQAVPGERAVAAAAAGGDVIADHSNLRTRREVQLEVKALSPIPQ
jgi:hypothetical protein